MRCWKAPSRAEGPPVSATRSHRARSMEIPRRSRIALDAAESSGKPYDAAIALGASKGRYQTVRNRVDGISRALMETSRARRNFRWARHRTVNTDARPGAGARQRAQQGRRAARAALVMRGSAPAGSGSDLGRQQKRPGEEAAKAPDKKATAREGRLAAVRR